MRLDTPEGPLNPSRRTIAASLFTAGYALALQPAAATAIQTDERGLQVLERTVLGDRGLSLPAYVVRPKRWGRRPAIVVVNEIFGIHEYIKDVCRRLAKRGFVAIAPDYFNRAGDPSTVSDMAAIRRIVNETPIEQVMGDTGGAVDWLRGQRYVKDQRIGIMGYCWGGAVVWQACERFDVFKAGVAWYGRLTPPPGGNQPDEPERQWPVDLARRMQAPVLGLYGGRDQGIPVADVERMRAALMAADNPTGSEIVVYPEAQHGFHADYRPSYNQAAAEDGWNRALAWFRNHGLT